MSLSARGWTALLAGAAVGALVPIAVPVALAQPVPDAGTDVAQPPAVLHNVVYRARIDGVSRGATITYQAEDNQQQTATPTMVPGRTFEVNTVLPGTGVATMRLSIQWPYSANLHCEILVDDALAAQADDFVAPRVLPQREDPDYGALTCEAPVTPPPVPPAPPTPPAA